MSTLGTSAGADRSAGGATRRQVLVALFGLVPVGLGSRWIEPGVVQLFRSPDAAARVGAWYLRRHPQEASLGFLRATTGLGERPGPIARRRFSSLVSADFARGDTVVVGGWVLARSECRLCGLVALERQVRG